MISYTHPIDGTIHEFETRTDGQRREAYKTLKSVIEAADEALKPLKAEILAELERNGEKPIVFADGEQFVFMRRAVNRKLERGDLLEIVGDEDAVNEVMKVDVPKAEKLVSKLETEGVLTRGATAQLGERITQSYTAPYPQLVKVAK